MQEGQDHPGKGHLPEMGGRRYYESDESRAMQTLQHMMDNTDDPEYRHALRLAMDGLRMK